MLSTSVHIGYRREQLARVAGASLLLLLIVLSLACVAVVWRSEPAPRLANIEDIPIGGAIQRSLALPFDETIFGSRTHSERIAAVVPVYIVRPSRSDVLVLSQRDPRSGCSVVWWPADQVFIDPCHGSTYTYTGEYVRGPARDGLGRFPFRISWAGDVLLTSTQPIPGSPAR